MKPVVLLLEHWNDIQTAMRTREKPSVMLSRTKRREVLGFTERYHEEYVNRDKVLRSVVDNWLPWADTVGPHAGKVHQCTVHLDFYDEQKRIMFLLKYGNHIK